MTEITFTQRDAKFVKRFTKIYAKKFKKYFEETSALDSETFIDKTNDDSECIFRRINGANDFTAEMKIDFEWLNDCDNGVDMDTLKPIIIVKHGQADICEHNFEDFNVNDYEQVDALVKTYIKCNCEVNLAVEDGFCDVCYCLATEQEDVCCICTENEGVWVKLQKCGHKLHRQCYSNIKRENIQGEIVRKCPLCREIVETGCYDVI